MKSKLLYFEGMRALMALNVILCHFVCVYYPEMYFVEYSGPLFYFATTPLSVLTNGNIAVLFFFALTGFLVGRSVFIKNIDVSTISFKAFNRYLRLLPVVAIATFFTFLTMKMGLQYHLNIVNENVNVDFLSAYCNFDASLGDLVINTLFLPFVEHSAYIGPFWTIKYELWGYIIALVMAISLKDSKWRRLSYSAIIVIMAFRFDVNYSIFIMGLLVSDIEFNQQPTVFGKLYEKILKSKFFVFACFIIGTYFACCPLNELSPIYSFWFKLPLLTHTLLRGLGISLFMWVAVNSKIIQKTLSFKPLVFLGEMSFETYALHWPIMLSCEAKLFLVFEKHFVYDVATLLSFAITLVIIYVLSFLFRAITKRIGRLIVETQNRFTRVTS